MKFAPEYVSNVLHDNFEDAKTLFLPALIAVNYAHLVMLAERRIVAPESARSLRNALDGICPSALHAITYDGTYEDLYFLIEQRIVQACGEVDAGRLHTALSRNDVAMTMYRMRQREFIVELTESIQTLSLSLLEQAEQHRHTLLAVHTHTQPAQPTTLAHYLLAMIEQLQRDVVRLHAAFSSTNRSPLGSCAVTGTGFDIDRHLTSDLLGFDGPTGNTYGSIATVDYLLESVLATSVALAGIGRFVQDMLLWSTVEFGYLKVANGFVQSSSIMPQKRNPVALEHARALSSKALGQAAAVTLVVHNTPFGDIVDTEDDLQPLVASMFRDARRAVALVAATLKTAAFDVRRLESRAGVGGTTLTELADHLVRKYGVAFRTAHRIVAQVAQLGCDHPDDTLAESVAAVCRDILGAPLPLDVDEVSQVVNPRHFVDVRNTHGGPAPSELARATAESRETLYDDATWLANTKRALSAAEARLKTRAMAL